MNKKEYDRQYMQDRYQDYRQEKDRVHMELFGGTCFVCYRTDGYESFHLHHIEYVEESNRYSRASNDLWSRRQRLSEAASHPERFRLLCPRCHSKVGFLGRKLRKMTGMDMERLVLLARLEADNP